MLKNFALPALALLAATGCASGATVRSLQAPPPPTQSVLHFNETNQFSDAVSLEWIGGLDHYSYIFAEPNRNVMRPVIEEELRKAGLWAGTSVRSRYGLRIEAHEVSAPMVGAEYDTTLAATYTIVDRVSGDVVWRRDVRTQAAAHFLALDENDWRLAWFVDVRLAALGVANPFNYFAFASDSAAEDARRRGIHGNYDRTRRERTGTYRAARANYAAAYTSVSAFLVAFAADQGVSPTRVFPCWGSPEVEAEKRTIVQGGGTFVTDDCRVLRVREQEHRTGRRSM